jgi:hypothetical protein
MPNPTDAQASYDELLRAIEAEGYRVLMRLNGSIELERVGDK